MQIPDIIHPVFAPSRNGTPGAEHTSRVDTIMDTEDIGHWGEAG
jgi:hypothetical protein